MKKNLSHIVLIVVCAISLSACKQEGCTDSNALNYNIAAEKDDNSCVYCSDVAMNQLGLVVNDLLDDRWGSEFFQQPILNLEFTQKEKVFVYTDCGQSGCFFDVKISNITDKEISQLQFFVSVPNTNGFSYGFNQWDLLTLGVGQDTTITNVLIAGIGQVCVPINSSNEFFGNVNSAEYN